MDFFILFIIHRNGWSGTNTACTDSSKLCSIILSLEGSISFGGFGAHDFFAIGVTSRLPHLQKLNGDATNYDMCAYLISCRGYGAGIAALVGIGATQLLIKMDPDDADDRPTVLMTSFRHNSSQHGERFHFDDDSDRG